MNIPVSTFINETNYPNGSHPKCVDQYGCNFCKQFFETGTCKKRFIVKSLLRSKVESVLYAFAFKMYKIEGVRYTFKRSIIKDELYDIDVFTNDNEPIIKASVYHSSTDPSHEKIICRVDNEDYYIIIKERK